MLFLDLFLTFFKIGAFTFGGGYAMLPLMREEVASHGWISEQSLIDFIAVSESTPGPFAVNMATHIGTQTGGVFGAFCATLGVVLPSFIVILIVAKCFDRFRKSLIVSGCMTGLKSAVPGLIASAACGIAVAVFFPTGFSMGVFADASFYVSAGIALFALFLAFKKVSPILIICLCAVIGIASGYADKLF